MDVKNDLYHNTFFVFYFYFFYLSVFFKSPKRKYHGIQKNFDLPYYQIPDNPKNYTAATVAARMIDGLGFRYYWATESLREQDLNFKPNDDARTAFETINHILSLSEMIVNTSKNQPYIRLSGLHYFAFEQMRAKTLENFKEASDLLKEDPEKRLEEYHVIFKRSDRTVEYPFWNLINGPIADAIWHVGQVVSFRRSSGNPIHQNVNVFQGRFRE
jgi:hypothetical protein